MHINGNNINDNLSDQYINDQHHYENHQKWVESDKVVYRLFRKKNLLLIYNEPSKKHDTRSQKRVSKFEKAVLIVAKEVVTAKSKKYIN